jgi:hypothetical protein
LTVPGWGTGPQAEPRRPRTPVADLFEETFRLYRRSFLLFVGVLAVFQLPLIVASGPFTVWQLQWSLRPVDDPFGLGSGGNVTSPPPDVVLALIVGSIVFSIVAAVLGTFGAAAMSYIVARARPGDAPPVREVFLALRRLAGPIIGYTALFLVGGFLLIFGLITAVLIVSTIGLVAGGGEAGGAVLFGLLLVIGVCGMLVVIATIAIRLSLAIPALVIERLRPMDSFRRSWNLVRGSTWRTFGILVLGGLVVVIVTGLFIPIFIPGVVQGLLTGSPAALLLVMLGSGVAQLLVGPILPILVTLLYFDYGRSA